MRYTHLRYAHLLYLDQIFLPFSIIKRLTKYQRKCNPPRGLFDKKETSLKEDTFKLLIDMRAEARKEV